MASTVREQLGGNVTFPPPKAVTDAWKPEPCPDLTRAQLPWGDRINPWNADISTWPIDTERTKALSRPDVNVAVDMDPPGQVHEGSVGGLPYQVTGPADRAQTVHDKGKPPIVRTEKRWIWWPFWAIDVPVEIRHAIEAVTMPTTVRREGDPNGAWDQHAYILRPDANRLIEMILLEHGSLVGAEWSCGYDAVSGLSIWDTSKAWDADGQPKGIVAIQVPHMVHFVRHQELVAKSIDHALFMALANYAPGSTGYARRSDGSMTAHPLRGGERLRLPAGTADRRWTRGSFEHTVGVALERFGVSPGDRSDHSGSAVSKPGKIAVAQDPRIRAGGWKGLGLRLSDFEVVRQP